MTHLASCPVDGQQTEFFGISSRKTGVIIEPDDGVPYPEIERYHWRYCTKSADHVIGQDFNGTVKFVRSPFNKDELKALFPVSREA